MKETPMSYCVVAAIFGTHSCAMYVDGIRKEIILLHEESGVIPFQFPHEGAEKILVYRGYLFGDETFPERLEDIPEEEWKEKPVRINAQIMEDIDMEDNYPV